MKKFGFGYAGLGSKKFGKIIKKKKLFRINNSDIRRLGQN